ncbi:MAG TPA: ABC transporter permease [Candidatus Binatia bacterium]|nr:ABC transporter permease [Candidatus Binatia bacterium]
MRFGNELKEGMLISWAALRANKLRSSLTTLGIVIGVVTVTLMGTAIEGLNQAFLKSISTMGADVFFVMRWSWFNHSYADWLKMRRRQPFTLAQLKAVENQLTLARAVAPVADYRAPIKYRNRTSNAVSVWGTTEQFQVTSGVSVSSGRFLSSEEADGGRPVCVIGADVATNLFQLEDPIGKTVRLNQTALEVIGILEKQGNFLGEFNLDNRVILPLRQFMSTFSRYPDLRLEVKALNTAQMDEAKEELRGVLRKVRRLAPGQPDDFSINQQEMFIERFNRVAGTIAAVGLFITGLALFVGGIGIMNIMFVSVAERTHEIGIRKAIGAKRRTILIQFLAEAASICLFGGLLALAIAYGLTFAVQKFLPATMSLTVVAIALLVSIFTGVASGFFPAWRAARMDPVEALRKE